MIDVAESSFQGYRGRGFGWSVAAVLTQDYDGKEQQNREEQVPHTEISCTGKPCRQWLSRVKLFQMSNAQWCSEMGQLRGSILQLHHFCFAFGVNGDDE